MRTGRIVVVSIYVLVQLIYVIFFPVPFIGDSAIYLSFAQAAISEATYYPNPSSIYNAWLAAPVHINLLIVLLKITNAQVIVLLFNILLNTLQLTLLYKITDKLWGRKAADIAGLLYIVYLSNVGLVLLNLTELPFGVLILASFYFYVSSPSMKNGLLCGLMTGLAIGVRPTGWALFLAFLLVYLINIFLHKQYHIQMAGIVAGMLLYIAPMGILSQQNIGQFEFSSTTGPANLIMSANPHAKGVFDHHFFRTDSVYLTKKTYIERNEYLLEQSKDYIRKNPGKWMALIPRKFYSTFVSDVWAIPLLLQSRYWDLNTYIKGDRSVKEAFQQKPVLFRIAFWTLNGWQQMLYGVIMLFFMYQVFRLVSGRDFSLEALLLNLFIAAGVFLTIVASVGNPRYKYTFMIIAIMLVSRYVADGIQHVVSWKEKKFGKQTT